MVFCLCVVGVAVGWICRTNVGGVSVEVFVRGCVVDPWVENPRIYVKDLGVG
jgi:hypothetical protein